MYYDSTGEEIVGQESLNNAKRVLIAETLFEGYTRELNLYRKERYPLVFNWLYFLFQEFFPIRFTR